MLGGYQILDLTNINLEITDEAVAITDSGVLKQLLGLSEYIDPNYDFSRPLANKLKPFIIRLRDGHTDESIEASVWANLSYIGNGGLLITATILQGLNLELFVAFDLETDDDGNTYWVIDSASVKLASVSGGTKLYFHDIILGDQSGDELYIISHIPSIANILEDLQDNWDSLMEFLNTCVAFKYYNDSAGYVTNVLYIGNDEPNLTITFDANVSLTDKTISGQDLETSGYNVAPL